MMSRRRRSRSLTMTLVLGTAVSAAAVLPLAAVALGQLTRIQRRVDTLVGVHMRREALTASYLEAASSAMRGVRQAIVLGAGQRQQIRESLSLCAALSESLRAVMDDSLAHQVSVLTRQFCAVFDSLAALSDSGGVMPPRDAFQATLSLTRTELGTLLTAAARLSPSNEDSLIPLAQKASRLLDLDALVQVIPVLEPEAGRLSLRLDSLGRAMTLGAESLLVQARRHSDSEARAIAEAVSRGERNLIVVLAAALAFGVAWVSSFPRTLRVPLAHFTSIVNRAVHGDLDVGVRQSTYRELEDLAVAIDHLLESVRESDRLRAEKVRTHWRRLQLLARESREFWCICDAAGRPILTSAALAKRAAGTWGFPPAGFVESKRHPVDPTDPRLGSIVWLREIAEET